MSGPAIVRITDRVDGHAATIATSRPRAEYLADHLIGVHGTRYLIEIDPPEDRPVLSYLAILEAVLAFLKTWRLAFGAGGLLVLGALATYLPSPHYRAPFVVALAVASLASGFLAKD
jgi:hypothetical protein